MDQEYKRQVDELNKLWHFMIVSSNYKDIESKFLRIQGLRTNELTILRIISEKENVIIKDILEVLNVPKSTLTSMIDRLEKRNLIIRTLSNKDRRSYKLELTTEGKMAQEEHSKFEEEVYGKIMLSLDTYEDRENLLKLIRKMAYNISN
ncbi:MarR family winged helix-turn-helix transcriptional regulator [Clostridium estertheticum]|uniref:MarR family transcriptional regulator n=1 Tax=Clostridium estertheticum subsp. estertheticum TaxID=1552 RepID=A0A1J0GIU9_9CLOT|nr:MarR family transcriptional regulator [Clostridium estertheticum]APC40846.1 MarR family transcriptional regulator [Clostridium estertheticum subsp. estertheticum]MBW9153965.1 MarR family transcriptional regulator [Clostridium estertheticum]MBZ9617297.1 MarR family transcriptional regulator [Clostridium estertheticum subsp. laramiense]WAG72986.1 MarR family transcriptional regulator [Clostridium estertheticum]WLC85551.1 MarR family transcriptional regulator [Clostridium estertheticum]